MKQISFNVSREDIVLIAKVCERADKEADRVNVPKLERMSLVMDLSACKAQGCPVDFQALLDAEAFDFVHDVWGITRHMDRRTGELGDCFLPRTARSAA